MCTPVTSDSCERCVWVVSLAVAVPAFGSMTLSLSEEVSTRGAYETTPDAGLVRGVYYADIGNPI